MEKMKVYLDPTSNGKGFFILEIINAAEHVMTAKRYVRGYVTDAPAILSFKV